MLLEYKKYRRFISIGYQKSMEFRFNVFCSIAVFMFPVVAKVYFWKAVYGAGGGEISGFNMTAMVTYVLVHQFVFEFTWCQPGSFRVKPEILQGTLTARLLLPVDYMKMVLVDWSGNMAPRLTSTVIVFIFLFFLFRESILMPAEIWVYPAAFVTIFLCYILVFMISFFFGLFAFWIEGDVPMIGQIQYFFAGFVVPLAFLPVWLQTIADCLPFKYTMYFPTMILMGKITPLDFLIGIFMQIFWIIIFYTGIRILWTIGIKRYGAFGG